MYPRGITDGDEIKKKWQLRERRRKRTWNKKFSGLWRASRGEGGKGKMKKKTTKEKRGV